MTWQQPSEDADVDVDVTGVRALLAGLPDPGPMPPEVSSRILHLLAQARAGGASPPARGEIDDGLAENDRSENDRGENDRGEDAEAVSDEGLGALGLGDVVTLDEVAQRRRGAAAGRSRWLVVGSAAAGVAAFAVAGTLLFRGTRQSSVASVQSRPGVAAGEATPGSAADAMTGKAAIVVSGRAYTGATIARLAEDLIADPTSAPAPTAPAGTATALPIATPAGLVACLKTLGEDDADRVAADIATFNGAPAVIIVTIKNGLKQVYAVDPSCNHGDPMILIGPLPMT